MGDGESAYVPGGMMFDEVVGWNIGCEDRKDGKGEKFTYSVTFVVGGNYRKEKLIAPVTTRCDGPCNSTASSKQMFVMGKCDHFLCKACYGIVKNPDGSYGCSNFWCCSDPEDSLKKARENYKKVIKKQAEHVRRLNFTGEEFIASSESKIPTKLYYTLPNQ